MQRRRTWVALLALSACVLSIHAAEKPTIKAYAVSVRKELGKEDTDISFGERTGTRVQVVLVLPERTMLTLDEKASKLDSFKDDVGTDLMAAKERFGPTPWVRSFDFIIGEKGDRATTSFGAPGLPGRGAKTVNVRGTMAVLCGASPKTVELKDVELKPDPKAKHKIGDSTFTIENSFGELALRFESSSPNIQGATFTASGAAINTGKPSKSRFGFNEKMTYQTNYQQKTKADKVTITLTYFEKIETVTVPVELAVGLGLE